LCGEILGGWWIKGSGENVKKLKINGEKKSNHDEGLQMIVLAFTGSATRFWNGYDDLEYWWFLEQVPSMPNSIVAAVLEPVSDAGNRLARTRSRGRWCWWAGDIDEECL
jgi:hypothetical protein